MNFIVLIFMIFCKIRLHIRFYVLAKTINNNNVDVSVLVI